MTPIEKNIRVVDELGNEYEATYPKRAKGLVKNGRARFVDEHTICLACSPNQMEENILIDNEKIIQESEDSLSAKDVMSRIAELQCHMIGNEMDSLHKSVDAVICITQNENIDEKSMAQQINDIKAMFALRETTLQNMLSFYQRIVLDICNRETKRVDLIKSAFSELIQSIDKSTLTNEDKFAAIGDVTSRIAELTDKLLFPGTTNKGLDRVLMKMTCIIESPDSTDSAKAFATDVLNTYMEWNTDE